VYLYCKQSSGIVVDVDCTHLHESIYYYKQSFDVVDDVVGDIDCSRQRTLVHLYYKQSSVIAVDVVGAVDCSCLHKCIYITNNLLALLLLMLLLLTVY